MSPGWEMWCGGYVITPAYLLLDSLWLLRGRISCSSSPHVRSIVQPWFTVFNPSAGWKRWMVLIHCCSLATTSSSLTHTHTHSLSPSLSRFFSPPLLKLSHSSQNPSSTPTHALIHSVPSLRFSPALLTAAVSSGPCQWHLSDIALIAQGAQPQFPILPLPLAVRQNNAFRVCL